MQREGEREGKERIKREEDTKKREMFKRLLRRKSKARKTAQLSEVDKNDRNELTNREQIVFEEMIFEGTPEEPTISNY